MFYPSYLQVLIKVVTFAKEILTTTMKKILLAFLMLAAMAVSHAEQLALFDQNHFDDWVYTRDNMDLNTENISQNKITLFHSNNGSDYTLISPLIVRRNDTIVVDVTAYSPFYSNDRYNATKGSPTIEILDEDDNVLMSVFHKFTSNELERFFTVEFDIRSIRVPRFKVRFACWNADTYCVLSMRKVIIEGLGDGSGVPAIYGDVNGDGFVTSADVTAIYDIMLGIDETFGDTADVNGDGFVTSADVTAVYDVMLGNV